MKGGLGGLAAALLVVVAQPVYAGYRNVSSHAPVDTNASAVVHWQAEIVRAGQEACAIPNRFGRFDTVELEALESVEVRLTPPEVTTGTTVFVYTVNGGRINGRIADTLTAGEDGRITFAFQAGRYFGDYPVVVRGKGREEVLTFWVRHAELGRSLSEGEP